MHRFQNTGILVILLISKVLILNLFSSEILSITIINPFTFINSIEDLNKRKDLQPILFFPHENIKNFQSYPQLKRSMTRALANDRQNQLDYNFMDLFRHKLNMIFDKVSAKQSHVLLASKIDTDLLISMNKIKYGPMTHVSHQHNYNRIYGYLFGKDINRFIAQTFHRV